MAGCCAMRPLVDVNYPNACEMKRLFVRANYQRQGLKDMPQYYFNPIAGAHYMKADLWAVEAIGWQPPLLWAFRPSLDPEASSHH